MEAMLARLWELLGGKRPAKVVTGLCNLVNEAPAEEYDEATLLYVCHDLKASNLTPAKKRLRALKDGATLEPFENEKLPKELSLAVATKRLCLNDRRPLSASVPTASVMESAENGATSSHLEETRPASSLEANPSNPRKRYREMFLKLINKYRSIKDACVEALENANENEVQVLSWIFHGYETRKQREFKLRLEGLNEQTDVSISSDLPTMLKPKFDKRLTELAKPPERDFGELAQLLEIEPRYVSIRERNGKFDIIGIISLVKGNDRHEAASDLRQICTDHPEVGEKISHIRFPGQGQRDTPCGDICTVVEVLMLLRGSKRSAGIRAKAARALVGLYGGDLGQANVIIQNRMTQEELAIDDEVNPVRVFGRHVENECGDEIYRKRQEFKNFLTNCQIKHENQREQGFDPTKFTSADHAHKELMLDEFLDGVLKLHKKKRVSELNGYLVFLDDFNKAGKPRVATRLLEEGFPAERMISPNIEGVVHKALTDLGVLTIKKDLETALDEDYRQNFKNLPLLGAYIDGTNNKPRKVTQIVAAVKGLQKTGPLAITYTLVEHHGLNSFVSRILEITDYMLEHDFKPQKGGSLERSFNEPTRPKGHRAGTAFWVRHD